MFSSLMRTETEIDTSVHMELISFILGCVGCVQLWRIWSWIRTPYERKVPKDGKHDIVVAFDIERFGGALVDNPVIQLGVAWHDYTTQKSGRHRWTFAHTEKFEDEKWEQRCKVQFWDKQPPELLERIKRERKPAKEEWKDFLNFWTDITAKNQVEIISDNPAYDIAAIDRDLLRYTGRDFGIRINADGYGYRTISDPTERHKFLEKEACDRIRNEIQKELASRGKKLIPHLADDDALQILLHYQKVERAIHIRRKSNRLAIGTALFFILLSCYHVHHYNQLDRELKQTVLNCTQEIQRLEDEKAALKFEYCSIGRSVEHLQKTPEEIEQLVRALQDQMDRHIERLREETQRTYKVKKSFAEGSFAVPEVTEEERQKMNEEFEERFEDDHPRSDL